MSEIKTASPRIPSPLTAGILVVGCYFLTRPPLEYLYLDPVGTGIIAAKAPKTPQNTLKMESVLGQKPWSR